MAPRGRIYQWRGAALGAFCRNPCRQRHIIAPTATWRKPVEFVLVDEDMALLKLDDPVRLAVLRRLIANERHVLVGFEHSQLRECLLIDEPDECAPYLHRFEESVAEGGDAMSPTTFAL